MRSNHGERTSSRRHPRGGGGMSSSLFPHHDEGLFIMSPGSGSFVPEAVAAKEQAPISEAETLTSYYPDEDDDTVLKNTLLEQQIDDRLRAFEERIEQQQALIRKQEKRASQQQDIIRKHEGRFQTLQFLLSRIIQQQANADGDGGESLASSAGEFAEKTPSVTGSTGSSRAHSPPPVKIALAQRKIASSLTSNSEVSVKEDVKEDEPVVSEEKRSDPGTLTSSKQVRVSFVVPAEGSGMLAPAASVPDRDEENGATGNNYRGGRSRRFGRSSLMASAVGQSIRSFARRNIQYWAGFDQDGECILSEDVYSLMYIAPFRSATFYFSLFVCLFQLTLIILVLVDQITARDSRNNPLSLPPAVAPQVAGAQGLCMLLAVAVQQDLIQAVTCLHAGHDDILTKDIPAATRFKFLLSNCLQLVVGVNHLCATFFLIMGSASVIDVFLNFAGLEFISLIDDACFALAQNGFVTKSVQRLCELSQEVKQPTARTYVFRRVCYVIAYLGLMIGFISVTVQQRRGDFLCSRIFLQLDDEFRPGYGGFSGEYVLRSDRHFSGRVYYLEVNSEWQDRQAILAYCESEKAWTHSYSQEPDVFPDPCDWKAKSRGTTESYDILTTSGESWLVFSEETELITPLKAFYMACSDCKGGDRGNCQEAHGTCVDNVCQCHEGNFGLGCAFRSPCEKVQLDARLDSFADAMDLGGWYVSDKHKLLRDDEGQLVLVHNHPVYHHRTVMDGGWESTDLILYSGYRWLFTLSWSLHDLPESDRSNMTLVIEYLRHDFHSVFSPFEVFFMSYPMAVGSNSYNDDVIRLRWTEPKLEGFNFTGQVEVDKDSPFDSTFLCAVCDPDTNRCLNHGECNENTGKCRCKHGYHGSLCEAAFRCSEEYPCLNNGVCMPDGSCLCATHPEGQRFFDSFCEMDASFGVFDFASSSNGFPWHNRTSECGCNSTVQIEYRGKTNVTMSGAACIEWGAQIIHPAITPQNFPEAGLESNFCRNPYPQEYSSAWCYIQTNETDENATDSNEATVAVSWEACNIQVCPADACPVLEEFCGCENAQQSDYRGTANVTNSGRNCLRWDSQAVRTGAQVTPVTHRDAGLEENYCRNPDQSLDVAWCYSSIDEQDRSLMIEPCSIPFCPASRC